MQVDESVAFVDDFREKRVRNASGRAAVGITGKVTVQVASVGQITGAPTETLQIHDRNADDRSRQLGRLDVVKDPADNLYTVQLISVHGRCEAKRRPRHPSVDDENRRRDRNSLEQFRRRPGQSRRRTRCNAAAKELEWFGDTVGRGHRVRQRNRGDGCREWFDHFLGDGGNFA